MKPYTIKVFVAQGDPEGVRIIDQMNWTGRCLVFPREKWPEVRSRDEFNRAGVYILIGPDPLVDDKQRIYVGEGDGVRDRIEAHVGSKAFWSTAITFISTSGGLNKAHVQWIESALVKRAKAAGRCVLDNGNVPQPPGLTEQEIADVDAFLMEMLKILPLVEVRVFEPPRGIVVRPAAVLATSASTSSGTATTLSGEASVDGDDDTIIVPAKEDGFQQVFLGEHCWHAIRIGGGMRDKIKYIAAYQSKPIAAVTHIAPVSLIEPYGDGAKYKLVFAEPATTIKQVPLGDSFKGTLRSPRYTSRTKLLAAKSLAELLKEDDVEVS